jgi:cyclopropane-fatty-acyl-phospholipid synthase
VSYITARPGAGATSVAASARQIIESIAHGRLRQRPINMRFWDGSVLPATARAKAPTLVVHSPRALAYLLRAPGELGLGAAWIAGELGMEGDLEVALGWRQQLRNARLSAIDIARIVAVAVKAGGRVVLQRPTTLPGRAIQRGRVHSLARDRAAIQHHYDVSNEFYKLVLGPTLVYSCAYFDSPQDTLEAAQARKLELICRKLSLRPGDRLLDIGCGWGSLLLHAAEYHGVHALGVTLSQEQARLARERIREAGLQDRCEVRVQDYRELHGQQFDAISSVGMYEHVGRAELATYVETVKRLLAPGGTFMNHGITRLGAGAPTNKRTFINTYVFPDGELHPLTDILTELHRAGMEVRDVESLREHYALTLRRWVANLEANLEAATREAGPARARIWQLYMAGSASAFTLGDISVYQTVAVNGGSSHRLPLNREQLIGDPETARLSDWSAGVG